MPPISPALLLSLATLTSGYLVPDPTGPYNITLTTGSLVDYSRNDIYAASPTPRALMLSVFQPATCAQTVVVPDMPKKTAKFQGSALKQTLNITTDFSPLFLQAHLPVCPDHHDGCSPLDDSPILLFSPGYSIPRLYYNVLASAIASEGFIVITIDHPSDANIIIYPDGNAVYNNATIQGSPTWDEYTRAADASFIIDQLSNATAMAELLPHRGSLTLPTDRIAMLGHSCGGASAIIAAHQDPRIRAAVNWDGTILGSPPLSGLSQPVLFLTHDNTAAPDWLEAWRQLQGPKLMARVAETTHYTFSDVPSLLQAAGQSAEPFADLLGTITPAEMVRILTAYTTTWMTGAFKGKEDRKLLQELKFPEVSILMKSNF